MTAVVERRKHDLPPLWDGAPVTWTEWAAEPAVTICYRGRGKKEPEPAPRRCPSAAGTLREQAWGLIGGLRLLHVVRCCHDCCQDSVYDIEADEAWDLDDTDYGDEGSVDPSQVQGALF